MNVLVGIIIIDKTKETLLILRCVNHTVRVSRKTVDTQSRKQWRLLVASAIFIVSVYLSSSVAVPVQVCYCRTAVVIFVSALYYQCLTFFTFTMKQ